MANLALGEHICSPCKKSRRFELLQLRVSSVAAALGVDVKLIPSHQDETDRLHAFRVLMHAEVQDYLEKIVLQILDVTENRIAGGVVTHAGHHLIVTQSIASVSDRRSSARATYPPFKVADLIGNMSSTRKNLEDAIKAHRKRVKDNSGIKASNLQTILLPVGYRDSFFSAIFKDKMNELGEARGHVAHASGLGALVGSVPTGARELQRFSDIKDDLSRLDRYAPRMLMPAWK